MLSVIGSICDRGRSLHLTPLGAVFSLVVLVTVGLMIWDLAMAAWRHQPGLISIGALAAVLGFSFLFSALGAQFRRLEQSEARFRDFALTSSDWFWETDENHCFVFYAGGPRSRTGASGVLGRTRWQKAADVESNPKKWEEHRGLLERHEPFRDFVHFWRNDDGSEGIASISGTPFFDTKGRFLGYRGTGRDISAQVAAEEALIRAQADADQQRRVADETTQQLLEAQRMGKIGHWISDEV